MPWFGPSNITRPIGRRSINKRRTLRVETLDERVVPTATPTVTLAATSAFIGGSVNYTLLFQNTGNVGDTGYSPYAYVVLPSRGIDGNDGISYASGSATYLGASVTTTTGIVEPNGDVLNLPSFTKRTALNVGAANAGQQIVFFQYPLGNFAVGQPGATINFQGNVSNLADVNAPLTATAVGGFANGGTATGVGTPTSSTAVPFLGAAETEATSPILFITTKQYDGPENETATGPSFRQTYTIKVQIAAGQTLTNFDITDFLPNDHQYTRIVSNMLNGTLRTGETGLTTPAGNTATAGTPGGTLIRRFASVTGTGNDTDLQLTVEFYIPRDDNTGVRVLPLNDGAFDQTPDNYAESAALWTPIDGRDGGNQTVTDNDPSSIDRRRVENMQRQSIAVQKGVTIISGAGINGTVTRGAVLEYTLNFQVSDYFAFTNVVFDDVIRDGLEFLPSFTPTFTINNANNAGNTAKVPTTSAAFALANYDLNQAPLGGDPAGSLRAQFRLSNELILQGLSGALVGGEIPAAGTGGPIPTNDSTVSFGTVTGTITFRAVVLDQYRVTLSANNNNYIKQGDVLPNSVTTTGRVRNHTNLADTGIDRSDDSGVSVRVATGSLAKSIYAINGNTSVPANPQINPGDTVTYRLQYVFPVTDAENFSITDYLPQPVFLAADPDFTGGANGVAEYMLNYSGAPNGAVPATGTIQRGPVDTYYLPGSRELASIAVDTAANTLRFNFASNTQPNTSTTLDVLFTIRTTDAPYADGLFLTNQARASEENTQNTATTDDEIVRFEMLAPVLQITKGIVAHNSGTGSTPTNPAGITFDTPGVDVGDTRNFTGTIGNGTTPPNSNVTNLQAGDFVKYAVVVRNTGRASRGVFDVVLNDTLPAGFRLAPNANFKVTDGAGNVLTYTGTVADFFNTGITLNDNLNGAGVDDDRGAIADGDVIDASNIVVITYDLEAIPAGVAGTAEAGRTYSSTANVVSYANLDGGGSIGTHNDPASASIIGLTVVKALVSTSIVDVPNTNSNTQAVIGETVSYGITVTVPQGRTPNLRITDDLANGRLRNARNFVVSGVSANLTGVPPGSITPTGDVNTGPLTFTFSDVLNNNANSSASETFVITYDADVANIAANQSNSDATNTSRARWDVNGVATNSLAGTATVDIIEPNVGTTKTVAVRRGTDFVSGSVVNPSGGVQADDIVRYTLTLTSNGQTIARDVTLNDPLPAVLVGSPLLISAVLNPGGTDVGGAFEIVGGVLRTTTGTSFDLAVGETITLVVESRVTNNVNPGVTYANTVTTPWSSLDGVQAGERTGTGGVNDYTTSASVNFSTQVPTLLKSLITTTNVDTGLGVSGGVLSNAREDLAVGELATFQFTIAVPQGTNPVTLRDVLPTGLEFVSGSVVSIGGNTTVGATSGGKLSGAALAVGAAPSVSGQTVTFAFGTSVLNDPALSGSNTIIVEIVARATTQANGFDINNNGNVDYGNGLITSNTVQLETVRPTLQIVKSVNDNTADAGDLLTYTLVVSHAAGSSVPAYDLNIADLLNANSQLVPGTVTVSVNTGTVNTSVTSGNTVGDTTVSVTGDRLALNQTLTITFQARLQTTTPATTAPAPGGTVNNNATVNGSTMPGSVTGELTSINATDDEPVTVNTNTLAGVVYVDANNNGAFNGGETLLSGTTITLTGTEIMGRQADGTPITRAVNRTFTTGSGGQPTGAYLFDLLRAGNYTVTETTQPAGHLDGRDTEGTLFGGTGTAVTDDRGTPTTPLRDADAISGLVVPLGGGNNAINYNFGELRPASVSNLVFEDANRNGTHDGEAGVQGVAVTLNGTDDTGRPVTVTTTTDTNGQYSFNNLRPATYVLTFSNSATIGANVTTYTRSPANVGGNDAIDSDANTATGVTPNVTLTEGQSDTSVDAGIHVTTTLEDNAITLSLVGLDTTANPPYVMLIDGVAIAQGASQAVANGIVTVNPGGTLTFTPNANYNGSMSFTYTANTANGPVTATVPIVVIPVNDPPVNTVPPAQAINEDTLLVFNGPRTISVADVDVNLATTQLTVNNGVLWVSPTLGGTVTGNGTNNVLIAGTQAQINAALATLTYQGHLNYHGPDLLTVASTDAGSLNDTDTVPITVVSVNDPPTATIPNPFPASGQILRNTPITFNLTDIVDPDTGESFTVRWDWDGDGILEGNENQQTGLTYGDDVTQGYTFPNAGVYTVRVTVIDAHGGSTTYTFPIDVRVVMQQPNGDLFIEGTDIDNNFVYYPGMTPGTVNINIDGVNYGDFPTPVGSTVRTFARGINGDHLLLAGTPAADDFEVNADIAPTALSDKEFMLNGVRYTTLNAERYTLYGMDGNDNFRISGLGLTSGANTRNLTIDGSGNGCVGYDTITSNLLASSGVGAAVDWLVEGPWRGQLEGTIKFSSIWALAGNELNDNFKFLTNAAMYGFGSTPGVAGNGGTNVLDLGSMNNSLYMTADNTGRLSTSFTSATGINTLTAPTAATDRLIGAAQANTWNVTGTNSGTYTSGGNPPLAFTGLEMITGGSAADTFLLATGGALTGTLDGGSGTDILSYVGRTTAVAVTLSPATTTSITGAWTGIEHVVGGSGSNTLTATNTLNTWTLTGPTTGTLNALSFTNFGNLVGGGATDHFLLGNAGTVLNINANGGADTLSYAGATNGVTMSPTTVLAGSGTRVTAYSNVESLIGGNGPDTLNGFASANAFAISGVGTGTLNTSLKFSSFENLVGGAGNDTFTFTTTSNNAINSTAGNGGTDTITGANVANTWTLTGAGSGTQNGVLFSGIENLTGSGNADVMDFSNGSITGIANGGTGSDTINVGTSNLTLTGTGVGTAAGRVGSFTSMENLVSNGGTLQGANTANVWKFTGLNTGTLNTATKFSGFANYNGGTGTDKLSVYQGGFTGVFNGGAGTDTLDYTGTVLPTRPYRPTYAGAAIYSVFSGLAGNPMIQVSYMDAITGNL